MTKAAYVGVSDLPEGYTKLEYVESNGNQYIDTGYVQINDVMEVDITFVPLANASYYSFFGVRSYNNYSMALYGYGTNTSSWFVGQTSLDLTLNTGTEYTINAKNDALYSECEFIVSGGMYSSDDVMVLSYDGSLNKSDSMYLFAQNQGGESADLYKSCCRIKHFAYKDNGVLVRDYVPVLNPSDVAGMFDMVEQKFYPSNTSTAFIAGPTVSGGSAVARKIKKGYIGIGGSVMRNLPSGYTQLAYIESTGSQYIDTGICPNYKTRVRMEVSDVALESFIFGARDTASSSAANQYGVYMSSAGAMRSDYFGTNKNTAVDRTERTVIDKNANVVTGYGVTITNTAVSSGTCANSLLLFAVNNAGTAYAFGTLRCYGAEVRADGITLDGDYVPAKNSAGEVGLYDKITKTFLTDAAGVGFVAGPTATPDGTARKIKKAYIGVGGVARPFWSGGELAYYGTATALSLARSYIAATSVGGYALFGGGYTSTAGGASKIVDAYDASLTMSNPTGLGTARYNFAATAVGDYALFGGGYSGSGALNSTDAYNKSLTRSSPTALSVARYILAATTVGDYALFGGGYLSDYSKVVDAYDTSLTRSVLTTFSVARRYHAATTVGDYALFGGGQPATKVVEAYDASLTRSRPASLTSYMLYNAATTVGDYALFGGGNNAGSGDTCSAVVNSYDPSLTRSSAVTPLSVGRQYLKATTVGDYALFGGGTPFSGSGSTVVDAYNLSLTRSVPPGFSVAKSHTSATAVGDYALFSGGQGSTYVATVEVYAIA